MTKEELFSRGPTAIRSHIPVFLDKGPDAVRADRYEQYWEVVVRQLLLHYADWLGRAYGFASANAFVLNAAGVQNGARFLEIGGGVGRLAGELALQHPEATVHLVDYSYNMLRSARDLWVSGRLVDLDGRHLGWPEGMLQGRTLTNLWLGQARGEDLPFRDETMDLVASTFFIDRAADLERAIHEMWRVLRPGGRLVAVSPLNFQQGRQWERYGEPEKITELFRSFGFRLLQFEAEIICREPLDGRGNVILWRAAGWVFEKRAPFSLRHSHPAIKES